MSDSEDEAVRKVAVVTGGATGVGAATAVMLAKRGYNIAIVFSRSEQEAQESARHCRAQAAETLCLRADVSQDGDCRGVATSVAETWGRADALVNAAGTTMFANMVDLDAQSSDDLHRVFAVNTVGPFQMARAMAPLLKRSRTGAICNVSSVGSLNGNGSSYAYVLSKAALNSLTVALARNLAPEVRVNAVLPGLIDTRWLRDGLGHEVYEKVRDTWADASALGTYCSAEDVAQSIVWLIVDASRITGQLLTVDGGYLLGRPTRVGK